MDKILKSGEDYLEAVLFMEKQYGKIRCVDVSRHLGVSRPSVSRALGILSDKGYINKTPYGDITITAQGRKRAEEIAGRHFALTDFLTRVLGVDKEIAEADACKIEHDISDCTMQKLLKFMRARDADAAKKQ